MSDSPTPARNTEKGRHYEFIKNNISDNFKTATVSRGQALAAIGLKIEPWYTTSPAAHHDKLKAANLKAWSSQNQVDQLFKKLQDVHSFAAPLLQAKLKEQYGIENDVKTTFLRLYVPKDLPWYAIELTGGITVQTISLLDAALHNFAKSETVNADSEFITQPDKRGHFDVIPIKHKMTIGQFQTLCRELDIGARYKEYLERDLLPDEPVAKAVMKHKVTESQKDALAVAAQLALTTGDIQYDAYKLMLDLAKDKPQLLLNGKQMLCCDLSMIETRLTGIVLLIPAVLDSAGIRRLIAYVPHDPDHPLKEYESPVAFVNELARQLRENNIGASSQLSYRQFFSQFVDQQQRGHFFAELEQLLFTVKWHQKEDPADQRPAWRKEPVLDPRLQLQHVPLPRDYWEHAYQQKLNKILNDAREIAVSTADTDSNARWAWWDNFKKIVSDIFNAALLVLTPFVPGLGELMLAYTAYQLTSDVIEGIVDLAEGLAVEAAEHMISVVTDVMQLAAFGMAAEIGKAFRLKLSPLVEGMEPVTLSNGKQTLWHSDLKPYEQTNLNLPTDSKPDILGLHQYLNQDILPLEGKLYAVETSDNPSSTHRIKHPSRSNAYSPKLEHNGNGAWVHEGENPLDWKGETLMRRLGQSVERFTPAEYEQIRISSGTDEAELRRMHAEHAPPPPLLVDAIKRFGAFDDVQIASANIRAGRPLEPSSVWFEPLLTRLQGWPAERALKVYERSDLSGQSRIYGNADATDANTLSIGLPELLSGRLPERVSVFLNDTEINALLGREVPHAKRTQAVRDRLADAVDQRQGEISKRVYQAGERSNRTQTRVLKRTFPDMPLTLTEKVLAEAKPAELQRIADESHLPLRIKTLAREVNFEASTTRAYDGFYHDEMMVPNTEMLALKTLMFHSESLNDLRIEVRDGVFDGALRCSVGTDDASMVRLLIRDEQGRYEVLDGDNRRLHKAVDFYEAILNALPDDKRTALGYVRGHGRLLKLWIMEISAPSGERRTLLADPPIRTVATIETVNLVRGPFWFFGEKTPEQRIKELHPQLSDQQVTRFLQALRAKGDPDQAIDRIRDDLKQLRNTLQAWRDNQPTQLDSAGDPCPIE
ncbi:MAG: dermonecrotic toxin domain-containing protein, partial [Pseudomonas fluorescens]